MKLNWYYSNNWTAKFIRVKKLFWSYKQLEKREFTETLLVKKHVAFLESVKKNEQKIANILRTNTETNIASS